MILFLFRVLYFTIVNSVTIVQMAKLVKILCSIMILFIFRVYHYRLFGDHCSNDRTVRTVCTVRGPLSALL